MDDLNAELGLVDAVKHQAPVDIRLGDSKPVTVPDLVYRNYENTPVKMKLNNTGYTVTVSGKFEGDPPTISGGPLGDSSYKFSQLHFHWGPGDEEGSEHTFEGRSVPLEMHVVHVNQKYDTQEKALLENDGVVILAFLFISGGKHAGLEGVTRGLAEISKPHTSFKITPQSLQSLCTPFQRDCFSYWGSVISPSCSHLIQWFVCRDPLQASPEQFAAFRRLLNVNEEPLLRNYRDTQALKGRTVFHLSPGSREGFTLNCSPDKTSVAPGAGGRPTEPGQEASVLSVERPCTSLEQAESKAGVNLEEGAVQRTESGRELVTTPSGRLVHKTASGRLVEKTASGRMVEKTASGRLVEKTASGRLVEKTASGRLVERTASGRLVERTPSGHLVQRTASGRLVEKTPSGRLLERSPSGRLLQRTASGNLVETTRTLAVPATQTTPSGHQLETTPSGRLVERTPSGRELERTPSGRLMTRTASGRLVETSRREAEAEGQVEEPAEIVEREKADSAHQLDVSPSGAVVERTASGREMVLSPSGNLIPRVAEPESAEEASPSAAPEAQEAEPVLGTESGAAAEDEGQAGPAETAPEAPPEPTPAPTATIPPSQGAERTPSGRLPSMGSRVVSFSQLTGPIKQRSGDTWPDAPYTGPAAASPIFLDTNQAARLPCPPLQFQGHFQSGVGLLLTNSGETVEISLLKTTERPVLQGGPLQGRYILDSAHFHWLPNDDATGGTHTINNSRAEIECHLVHIHEDYKSKTEAMDHPNGLAVVSILHQVGGAECEAFQRLCKELPRINELYTQVELPGMDLSYMASVVKPHEYFLYPGRFFGREDGKALVWIVFAQPVGICCKNVAAFQSLKLSLDFRQHDTYPLGERPLFAVIAEGDGGPRAGGGEGEGADVEEELTVGDLRRTASGRVHGIAADEWPNAPFQSKHDMLMAPLDILTSTVPSVPMPPLEYRGHFPAGSVTVEMRNTGEAVDITWKDPNAVPTLVGGPLTDEYIFDSAHFHWAQNPDDVGAMHRINGKRCDLEFHMVHFKKSLKTRLEAMVESDGLAVTSFLIRVGGQEDESFAQLTDVLPNVKAVDASTELSIKMDWLQHRAGPHGFFTYPGTLFGADQAINVIWMVYPTPVQICCQHVARFYQLQCLETNRIHPLHEPLDRPIFHSINPDNCTS